MGSISLTDIGPLTKEVPFREGHITVKGIPAIAIFHILKENVAIKTMMMDRALNADNVTELINSSPMMIGEIIVACTGTPRTDETVAKIVGNMSAGEQWGIVEAAIGMTFPQGLQSFMDALLAVLPSVPAGQSGKEADTK